MGEIQKIIVKSIQGAKMIEELKDLKEVQIIVFRLGNEEYAVPIMNVQEIIMRQDPTHIPKSPSFVEGVINLRGRIIPVIDGRKKFQIVTNKEVTLGNSRIMVMDVDSEIVGIIVDEVSEVIHLNTADIDPAPVDTGEDADFLWGIGKTKDRLLILLNPNKFLSHHETKDLQRFTSFVDTMKPKTEEPKSAVEPVKPVTETAKEKTTA